MPLGNNASYIPTINEFLAHWNHVDGTLSNELVVAIPHQDPIDRPAFIALRDSLDNSLSNVIDRLNDKEIARGGIEILKASLLKLFNEFNGMLDSYWAGTAFLKARPYAPHLTDGQENFLSPLRDAASLWDKLNAASAPAGLALPLILSDGTTAADLKARMTALKNLYIDEAAANQNAVLARAHRDEIKALAKAVLITYRKIVAARCAQHPTLVSTLPAVTPAPGHTPKPVNASAVFIAPDQAKIVHDASAEALLLRYELRGNPGLEYDDDDAVVISTHSPADPREFLTGFALTQPGSRIAMKVYVILSTGNEAGSAQMTVARPF